MAHADAAFLSAIDILTRAGPERDEFRAAVGADIEVDASLVSDLLRASGRVADTLQTRRAVVELCALLRAIDAAENRRIDLEELRRGLELHSQRTDGFADFHDARVLLRTLAEVLAGGRSMAADPRPLLAQLAVLHMDLRAWLLEQLTGDVDGRAASGAQTDTPADPRDPWRITGDDERRQADSRVEDLLNGARHHPVTGLLGAAWVRGWYAAPVPGERLGDDQGELDRLAAALREHGVRQIVQIDRARSPRWTLAGQQVRIGDRLRSAWILPGTREGVALAASERSGATILTSADETFAYVEGNGHHLVLGPQSFVATTVGAPPLEAIAAFRNYVEELADAEGEPPADLLAVATSCGRLRRRSR